jgi:hypothetical protein
MDSTDGFVVCLRSFIDSIIQVERDRTYREIQLSRFVKDVVPR